MFFSATSTQGHTGVCCPTQQVYHSIKPALTVWLLLVIVAAAARELVREVDYTLKTLAKNLLGQERSEVPSTGAHTGIRC